MLAWSDIQNWALLKVERCGSLSKFGEENELAAAGAAGVGVFGVCEREAKRCMWIWWTWPPSATRVATSTLACTTLDETRAHRGQVRFVRRGKCPLSA